MAEGATMGGFETWILVQNPGSAPAHVSLTYMTDQGEVQGPSATIEANSRKTFNVAETVQTWEVSTRVTSDEAVIAERAMYGGGRSWGTNSIGASSTSKTWYLAEGSTNGGMETWVLVQNPNTTPANIHLTYMTPDGAVKGPDATLEANSRKTFFAADTVPNQWSVSCMVTCDDQEVIVERAMYGNNRSWATNSVGVPEAGKDWYLAEGCTNGGFETWVLVQNPNPTPASIDLTYMTPNGAVEGPSETLPANSRKTYFAGDTVANCWEVSTKVSSTSNVIAERSCYGNNRTWAHESKGVAQAQATWYLAEGSTGGDPSTHFETWVLVQNPNSQAASIQITYMTDSGPVEGPTDTVPANSRKTYNIASTVPGVWEVSTKVTSNRAVIVERAMYGD
ncbi:MAG: hypothetical protein V1748_03945 [Actinomycetota bacterium]